MDSSDIEVTEITGAGDSVDELEVNEATTATVEVEHAVVTESVKAEQGEVTGTVKDEQDVSAETEEVELVTITEAGDDTEAEEAEADFLARTAWCRAARSRFLFLSAGPRW